MECGQPEAAHRREYTQADFARDVLRRYDRGEWTDAMNLIGHLAAAVRMLLEVTETDAGKLAEIRAVLDAFDWERDDRQYALEQIEMIVGGGAR